MRSKEFIVVLLVLFVVGAGAFFVGKALRDPLTVGFGGATTLPDGDIQLLLWATNRSLHCFHGTVSYPKVPTGVWTTNSEANNVFAGYFAAREEGIWLNYVPLSPESGQIVLLLDYQRLGVPHESLLRKLTIKFGLFPKAQGRQRIVVGPIDLPPR